jgi:hypothetical protein
MPSAVQFGNLSPYDVEYLVVAGGGGGAGASGGGGGAGGLLSGSLTVASRTVYTITIGAGGTRGVGRSIYATSGSNSVGFDVTAIGGGRGGADDSCGSLYVGCYTPGNGGSGGGAGYWNNFPGTLNVTGSGTAGQGNPGGRRTSGQNGSGGGGAGSAGQNLTSTKSGDGGSGSLSSITGVSTWYAGGGGGSGGSITTVGLGGVGGGGTGDYYDGSKYTSGSAGTANTGGGGGGGLLHAGGTGGAGGSGVVIMAYPDFSYGPIISAGLSYTVETTRSGYKVYKFTGGTGTIEFH